MSKKQYYSAEEFLVEIEPHLPKGFAGILHENKNSVIIVAMTGWKIIGRPIHFEAWSIFQPFEKNCLSSGTFEQCMNFICRMHSIDFHWKWKDVIWITNTQNGCREQLVVDLDYIEKSQ